MTQVTIGCIVVGVGCFALLLWNIKLFKKGSD